MDDINVAEIMQEIMNRIEEEYKSLKRFNVMVLGKTGIGKSTLINNLFGKDISQTGIGRPVTQEIKKYEIPDSPLTIYDTPGLELAGEKSIDSLLDAVAKEIETGINNGEVGKAIHCIWYCVSTPSHRFEQSEMDFLQKFFGKTSDVPVIIVLTQSFSKKDAKELKDEIEKLSLPVVKVLPVLAEDYDIDEDYTVKAYGLNELAQIVYNVIPEALTKTFAAIQKANFELKKKEAKSIIAKYAALAAATGATPIPMSDAPILIGIQAKMIASLTVSFGISLSQAKITAIISGLVGTTATTVLGKTIVSSLIKLIPGAGTITGGTISAATATSLTAALGEAYVKVLSMVYSGELSISDLSSGKGKQLLKEILREKLKIRRNPNGEAIEPSTV